jgi:hypothetical protein
VRSLPASRQEKNKQSNVPSKLVARLTTWGNILQALARHQRSRVKAITTIANSANALWMCIRLTRTQLPNSYWMLTSSQTSCGVWLVSLRKKPRRCNGPGWTPKTTASTIRKQTSRLTLFCMNDCFFTAEILPTSPAVSIAQVGEEFPGERRSVCHPDHVTGLFYVRSSYVQGQKLRGSMLIHIR